MMGAERVEGYQENDGKINTLMDEMVEEILIRLPAKTLFAVKCVCKKWENLISDRYFRKKFEVRSKLLLPLISGFFCRDTFIQLERRECVDMSLSFLGKQMVVVASSNSGLILCAENSLEQDLKYTHCFSYVVCNPLTRKLFVIPKANKPHDVKRVVLLVPKEEEEEVNFKVFALLDWKINVVYVEIFSSVTQLWIVTKLLHNIGSFSPIGQSVVAFEELVCIWDRVHRILCLYNWEEDSETRSLELPLDQVNESKLSSALGVSAGSMVYAESNKKFSTFSVWVLVEKINWCLIHTISYETLDSNSVFKPMAFHPLDSTTVLARLGSGLGGSNDVIIYHMDTGQIEVTSIQISDWDPVISYLLPAWLPCFICGSNVMPDADLSEYFQNILSSDPKETDFLNDCSSYNCYSHLGSVVALQEMLLDGEDDASLTLTKFQ